MFAKALFLLLTIFSFSTQAHVRWFVEDHHKQSEFVFDAVTLFLIAGGAIYCMVCYFLSQQASQRHQSSMIHRFLFSKFSLQGLEWKIFEVAIAIMLIGNMSMGVFLAPNLELNNPNLVLMIQGALIICLILDRVVFSIALLALVGFVLSVFGFELAVDYAAEFICFAVALGMMGICSSLIDSSDANYGRLKLCTFSSCALRIGMGLQLLILAVHNKFMNPDLGLMFLQGHPNFNFLNLLGFKWFTDLHFVFAGGLAEACFGLLLIFNVATRFVASCVFGIFLLTSIVMGVHELMGHLPVLAAMLVIWLNGNAVEGLNLKAFFGKIFQEVASKTRLLTANSANS